MRLLNKLNPSIPGLILAVAMISYACKKQDNNLGLDIQPPNDKLNVVYSDTTSIVAYSQRVDSVRTDETSVSLLGSLVDPVFGRTTASFYTQFRLSKTSYSFGDNPVADSLVLGLLYKGHYGDTLAPVTLKIYEMADKINIDSNYYSNQTVPVYETLLAQKTFVPDYSSDVVIVEDTLAPQLRINLGQLSSVLIDKLLSIPDDTMSTNDSFANYFYGLYFSAEPAGSGGQIIYFDLLSNLSTMTMYYHNDEEDSLYYDYTINSNCARFGHMDHDYSLADEAFKAQVLNKDTSLGKQVCYVQSLAGVKTFMRFPHIKNYYDSGKVAVNEARLFLYGYETDPQLKPASNLILVINSDTTGGYTITEDQLQGTNYYGGSYDSISNGYWFRITMTVQDLMRRQDEDLGLGIYMSGGGVNADRILLNGTDPQSPASPDARMKLIITYSTFK